VSHDPANEARAVERLKRAAEEARKAKRRAGEEDAGQAEQVARAMSEAAEALAKGDRTSAAERMEAAAQRLLAMEKTRARAEERARQITDLLETSASLERAVQTAMGRSAKSGHGREGNERAEGDGDGDRDGKTSSEAGGRNGKGKSGVGDGRSHGQARGDQGQGAPSRGGGHAPDPNDAKRGALKPNGSIAAPSQLGEGQRAILGIRGLGKGTEPPKEYREVFPTYDTAVEEGLEGDRIPAARRATVRRYFESIRPNDEPTASEKKP
jgi:hypothetical protein